MSLEKITAIRKAKNITLEELSAKSQIPVSTLKKISAGITSNPNLDTIKAIARALDCKLDDFDDDNPTTLVMDEYPVMVKYRALDAHGKEVIDCLLDLEYKRCVVATQDE